MVDPRILIGSGKVDCALAGNSKQPDLQMRFVPAVPVTADGINAYVKFA